MASNCEFEVIEEPEGLGQDTPPPERVVRRLTFSKIFSDDAEDTTSTSSQSMTVDEELATGESRAPHESQATPLQETRVYKVRYWILFIFSMSFFVQAMVWNTWGPIAESAEYAFGWTETTIAILSNYGPIGFIVAALPVSWAIDKWGLRPVMVIMTGACTVGHGLRCITTQPLAFTVLAHICAAINGVMATAIVACATIPAIWFPAEQRVTAMAVPNVLTQMGAGFSFLEPLVVRTPSNETTVEEVRSDIRDLMFIDLAIAGVIFVCILAYFPSAPPLPPTPSSTMPRSSFMTGLGSLKSSPGFWLLVISYAVSTGVSCTWISVILFSLEQFGFSQNEIGMLGLYVACCIAVISISSSWLTDLFYGHLKIALLFLMLLSSLSYVWFMLMSLDVISWSKATVYIAVLAGQSLNFATAPLFLELCCEIVYPTPEAVAGSVALLSFNVVGFLFLGLFYIPAIANSGPDWMTYLLVGSNFGMMLPVLGVKEAYHRSRLDRDNLS